MYGAAGRRYALARTSCMRRSPVVALSQRADLLDRRCGPGRACSFHRQRGRPARRPRRPQGHQAGWGGADESTAAPHVTGDELTVRAERSPISVV